PHDQLRLPVLLRGLPEAQLHPLRPPAQGEATVPDSRRWLPDHLPQREVEPDLRIEGEEPRVPARGPSRASQRGAQARRRGQPRGSEEAPRRRTALSEPPAARAAGVAAVRACPYPPRPCRSIPRPACSSIS